MFLYLLLLSPIVFFGLVICVARILAWRDYIRLRRRWQQMDAAGLVPPRPAHGSASPDRPPQPNRRY